MKTPHRRARLSSGKILTFPSHTPDHVLHRTVRRELGLGPPEPKVDHGVNAAQAAAQAMAEMARVSDAMTKHMNALAEKVAATGASNEQMARALSEMGASHGAATGQHMTHAQALTEAQKRVADAVSKHMGMGDRHHDVMKELSATQLETAKAMSRFVTAVTNIVKSIEGTKDTLQKINKSVDDLTKAMSAPKILVLDSKGNPIGVKTDN